MSTTEKLQAAAKCAEHISVEDDRLITIQVRSYGYLIEGQREMPDESMRRCMRQLRYETMDSHVANALLCAVREIGEQMRNWSAPDAAIDEGANDVYAGDPEIVVQEPLMKQIEQGGMADVERVARSLRRQARRRDDREADAKLTWIVQVVSRLRQYTYTVA